MLLIALLDKVIKLVALPAFKLAINEIQLCGTVTTIITRTYKPVPVIAVVAWRGSYFDVQPVINTILRKGKD
ncbi:hypothetical protein CDG61_01465 [Acinetobacter sp. WCHAc010052]|nr:hypothetical protein CDG61_01465 [Acinetobacter sp. WCHAc010052]